MTSERSAADAARQHSRIVAPPAASEAGFSLPELLIAVTVLLIISSGVTSALLQMTNSQKTIWNRTQMHAGVRSATELLQQEIGQAGLIALPGSPTLSAAVAAGGTTATLSSVAGMFLSERLTIDAGALQETVVVSAINVITRQITISASLDALGNTIQPAFVQAHSSGAPVRVLGGFGSGIVPPSPGFTNGSTGTVLKMYGDINGDGSMLYVEYTCDTNAGKLYRNAMPFNQSTAKAAPTSGQVLLDNILQNPGGTACFTYQPNPLPVIGTSAYVLNVAITLTVQTQLKDPITNAFQTETKALLNVSPRNVFNVWQIAATGSFDRVQPMPPTVAALLPTP